jgi:SAM-dependent methyltransferase
VYSSHPSYNAYPMDIQERVNKLASTSPFGWGHTIDFGDFVMPGLLLDSYKIITEHLTTLDWLPDDLLNLRIADVGCFSGGITKILAERNAKIVFSIDEIPEHVEQCKLVKEAFGLSNVHTIESSLYRLLDYIEPNSLDLILLSGVLYHLSDMLVGLVTLRDLLKPNGILLIETNAVNDNEHSYANFGRFYAGMWWQPTSLCISDMCEFMGFSKPDIHFHEQSRCLVKTTKASTSIPFKRGLNYQFDDIHDEKERTLDLSIMRPAE